MDAHVARAIASKDALIRHRDDQQRAVGQPSQAGCLVRDLQHKLLRPLGTDRVDRFAVEVRDPPPTVAPLRRFKERAALQQRDERSSLHATTICDAEKVRHKSRPPGGRKSPRGRREVVDRGRLAVSARKRPGRQREQCGGRIGRGQPLIEGRRAVPVTSGFRRRQQPAQPAQHAQRS